MSTGLRTPDRRECERCGRTEVWDEDVGAWQVHEGNEGRSVGNPFCIHEWDIGGSFSPVER